MNTSNTDVSKSKILVNVYPPLIALMEHKFKAACLKRDAYLDIVFKHETEFLRNEITTPNSDKIKSYISKNLKILAPKPVNFYLSQETINLINEVCDEKKVPRDVFFNRVILLLTASSELIRSLFPVFGLEWEGENRAGFELWSFWHEAIAGSPEEYFFVRPNILDTLEEFTKTSPLWLLRSCISHFNRELDSQEARYFVDNETKEVITISRLPELYSYEFPVNAFSKIHGSSVFSKTDNTTGFNTFMNEDLAICKADEEQLKILDKLYVANKKEAIEAYKLKKEIDDISKVLNRSTK
jgi:hypothetical protein